MRTVTLITIFIAFTFNCFGQDTSCVIGDCKNEYGSYFNQETSEVYHGFFKDGFYNGVGYRQNSQGYYYLSDFKDGKPNGYTVYNEGGGRTSGMYIEGLKYGSHVRNVENGELISREVINYHKGVLLDREMYTIPIDAKAPILAGNVEDGFGIAIENGMMMFGIFKEKQIIHGEFFQIETGVSEFFIMPTQETIAQPYLKIGLYPQEEGVQEIVANFIGRKIEGQYVVVNATNGQVGGAIFKDDEMVKKF